MAARDVETFLSRLPFARAFGMAATVVVPGRVIVEMPYQDRFSTPPRPRSGPATATMT